MLRALPVVAVLGSGAIALGGGAGMANALPPGPIPAPPPCTFTLSGPERAADSVIVTVQSVGCAALTVPYSTVACLQAGGGAPIQCVQAHGAEPAQVSLPYQPGVSFVASGRGCARWVNLEPTPDCQLLGPTSSAL